MHVQLQFQAMAVKIAFVRSSIASAFISGIVEFLLLLAIRQLWQP
jgi:hypothetical protein